MAVWLQVFGKKEFSSNDERKDVCHRVFSSVELDLHFLEGSLQNEDAPYKDTLLPNYFVYDKTHWQIEVDHSLPEVLQFVYPLSSPVNNLKVCFVQDFICFLGPFIHFSHGASFAKDKKLAEGYQNLIQTIYKEFGLVKAIYGTEWFFSFEEIDAEKFVFADLEKRMKEYSQQEAKSFHTMDLDSYFIQSF